MLVTTQLNMILWAPFILTLLCGVFAQTGPFEGFSCDRYSHIQTSCSIHGRFGIDFIGHDDGVTTGEELFTEISLKCSNPTFLEPYYNCLNDVITLCPHQSTDIMGARAEKRAFFCEGNHISTFLKTVFQAGYSYNLSCDMVLTTVVNECAQEYLSPGNLEADMTLSTTPKLMSVMFTCLNECFSGMSDSDLSCSSSQEDIVLRFWIQVLSDGPLGYSLSQSQRDELQNFVMRSKQTTNYGDIFRASLRRMAGVRKAKH